MGDVVRTGGEEKFTQVFCGEIEGEKGTWKIQALGEAHFRLGCKGTGRKGVDWIDRGQDTEEMWSFVNTEICMLGL